MSTPDAIARSKAILELVDQYHDHPTTMTRATLRAALMEQFHTRFGCPPIDYTLLIVDCYAQTGYRQGTSGCVQFAKGAEWFQGQLVVDQVVSPPDLLARLDAQAETAVKLAERLTTDLAQLRLEYDHLLENSNLVRRNKDAQRLELEAAYLEMRKIRPAVRAVFDRDVWDRAEAAK